ncbi:hypothetical protein DLAC_05189 [Tieghemostelium lacteum]|uniref:Opioid growth factor receptor (OGFr) conserved domain-containing protein n=1 Tax=Tieghemostelium lacteum TaxID=361077 RepID=A0A151ZIL2_TIELA|nr:hypothetical protein DLAC_05189 [Tieghemostelium lacteum]|eukprot:KYQ93796.1 hypothetical protein DLAC_05189 [Tieghemostelium lacteum]
MDSDDTQEEEEEEEEYFEDFEEDKQQIDITKLKNYQFYKNNIESKPHGDLISNIHTLWKDDMRVLERHHGYIQWLFPLFESNGVNFSAYKLEYVEAELFRTDLEIAIRIIQSYRMMLNFYGMRLVNVTTGEINRINDKIFQKQRYSNLESNSHNNLRISRIITFLGHVGFQRYKAPLIAFLESEIQSKSLKIAKYSLDQFWKPLIDHRSKPKYFKNTMEQEHHLQNESVIFQPENLNILLEI